jgi:hypothetical protein
MSSIKVENDKSGADENLDLEEVKEEAHPTHLQAENEGGAISNKINAPAKLPTVRKIIIDIIK